jgi:hypothetical protein
MGTQKTTRELYVTILTASLTRDALDHENVLSDDAWPEQYRRYLGILADAVRKLYPDAQVDEEPGNGLDSVRVAVWGDDGAEDYEAAENIRDTIEWTWWGTFERWCETMPASAYRG